MVEKLIDPAMSRLYYALFQAGIHAMKKSGKQPSDFTLGETKWRHNWIRDGARLFRGSKADKPMFQLAYSLRERADYRKQSVRRDEIDALMVPAEAFVQEVCS